MKPFCLFIGLLLLVAGVRAGDDSYYYYYDPEYDYYEDSASSYSSDLSSLPKTIRRKVILNFRIKLRMKNINDNENTVNMQPNAADVKFSDLPKKDNQHHSGEAKSKEDVLPPIDMELDPDVAQTLSSNGVPFGGGNVKRLRQALPKFGLGRERTSNLKPNVADVKLPDLAKNDSQHRNGKDKSKEVVKNNVLPTVVVPRPIAMELDPDVEQSPSSGGSNVKRLRQPVPKFGLGRGRTSNLKPRLLEPPRRAPLHDSHVVPEHVPVPLQTLVHLPEQQPLHDQRSVYSPIQSTGDHGEPQVRPLVSTSQKPNTIEHVETTSKTTSGRIEQKVQKETVVANIREHAVPLLPHRIIESKPLTATSQQPSQAVEPIGQPVVVRPVKPKSPLDTLQQTIETKPLADPVLRPIESKPLLTATSQQPSQVEPIGQPAVVHPVKPESPLDVLQPTVETKPLGDPVLHPIESKPLFPFLHQKQLLQAKPAGVHFFPQPPRRQVLPSPIEHRPIVNSHAQEEKQPAPVAIPAAVLARLSNQKPLAPIDDVDRQTVYESPLNYKQQPYPAKEIPTFQIIAKGASEEIESIEHATSPPPHPAILRPRIDIPSKLMLAKPDLIASLLLTSKESHEESHAETEHNAATLNPEPTPSPDVDAADEQHDVAADVEKVPSTEDSSDDATSPPPHPMLFRPLITLPSKPLLTKPDVIASLPPAASEEHNKEPNNAETEHKAATLNPEPTPSPDVDDAAADVELVPSTEDDDSDGEDQNNNETAIKEDAGRQKHKHSHGRKRSKSSRRKTAMKDKLKSIRLKKSLAKKQA